MALRGVRVVEMSGLAPGPFCGMILSDFGAKVVRVDKTKSFNHMDTLARGKKSIAVDLKKKEGVALIRKLCASSDVLIEPYRPGVMEKLGLGPELLMRDNPRLIYARLTGFGQSGYLAKRAGHDINYLAVSGVLSMLGRHGEKPLAPINFLADFAGGGLMCAFGIVTSLLERVSSGKGQVVDANMVEGSGYLGSFMWRSREMPGIWGSERGQNALDGGAHFYDTYKTADGKYMAVGAIEPQFYDALLTGVGLTHEELPQFGDWAALKEKLAERFASKTQAEWCKIFDHVDACVTPVVDWEKVNEYAHNMDKGSFTKTGEGYPDPIPAPRLSRTPGDKGDNVQPETGQDTFDILTEIGFSDEDILRLGQSGIIEQKYKSKI